MNQIKILQADGSLLIRVDDQKVASLFVRPDGDFFQARAYLYRTGEHLCLKVCRTPQEANNFIQLFNFRP